TVFCQTAQFRCDVWTPQLLCWQTSQEGPTVLVDIENGYLLMFYDNGVFSFDWLLHCFSVPSYRPASSSRERPAREQMGHAQVQRFSKVHTRYQPDPSSTQVQQC